MGLMGSGLIGPISPIGRIRPCSIAAAVENVVTGAQSPQIENENEDENEDDYGVCARRQACY